MQIGADKGGDKLERIALSSKAVALRALEAPVASAFSVATPELALGKYHLAQTLVNFGIKDVVQRRWGIVPQSDQEGRTTRAFREALVDRASELSAKDPEATDNDMAAYLSLKLQNLMVHKAGRGREPSPPQLADKMVAWAIAATEKNLGFGSSEEIFFKSIRAMRMGARDEEDPFKKWEGDLFGALVHLVQMENNQLVFLPDQFNLPDLRLVVEGGLKNDLIALKQAMDTYKSEWPVGLEHAPWNVQGLGETKGLYPAQLQALQQATEALHQQVRAVVHKFEQHPIGRQIWDAKTEKDLHLPRGL